MAINNPYVPGDPYSYDLKWIVANLKKHQDEIDSILTRKEGLAYDSLQDLIADENAKKGSKVVTRGYYSAYDGGAAEYEISDVRPTDAWTIALDNGLYAVMLSSISFKRIGMRENENNDAIMAQLVAFIVANEAVKSFSVYVDGINFEFSTIDLSNVFNLTLWTDPRGHGHYDDSIPNIIANQILCYTVYNTSFIGLSFVGSIAYDLFKFRYTCRNDIISQCYIRGAKTAIDIGVTSEQSDTASIIIEKCFLNKNDIGISCNSGNGRVQCRSNFLISNVRNYDLYGGVNVLEGNVSDSTENTFEGDIRIFGGGLSLIGHDSDCLQGYMVSGTPNLPVLISGCRHYDSGMTLSAVPYSIMLNGSTSAMIESCYLFNSIECQLGSNYHATVVSCYLMNGSVTGTGRIIQINSDSGSITGSIGNAPAVYSQHSLVLENGYGEIAEIRRGQNFSSVYKTQNGVQIFNNGYTDVSGVDQIVNSNRPIAKLSVEDHMTFTGYYNGNSKIALRAGLDVDIPYIMMGPHKIYLTTQGYMTSAIAGDIRFTGNTTSPFLQYYDGSNWQVLI